LAPNADPQHWNLTTRKLAISCFEVPDVFGGPLQLSGVL
jgi:hypothetical protein